jgi:hypothetical protein
MNEIFYEIKEIKNQSVEEEITKELVIHYLAKISDTLILYETKQRIMKSYNSNNLEAVIKNLQKIFHEVDPSLSLIKGKIREIYISYS